MRRQTRSVLIVGAGLAGTRCAETLRAAGFEGGITLVGAEAMPPYERPALSKELLSGGRGPDDLLLRPPSFWAEKQVELVLATRIASVDVDGHAALSEKGRRFSWDALVLATGARARPFRGLVPAGVHTLRSLEDALALRAALLPGRRLVVVGAGFIGTEVSSTARELGLEVVLVDAAQLPFERILGPEVGALLAARYRAHGVDLRLGASLLRFERGGRRLRAVLSDGTLLPCDAALVGLGAIPVAPLSGSEAGIRTDAACRSVIPDVFACGDIASAWSPSLRRHVRFEHWTNAAARGAAAARAVLGDYEPLEEVPYFWSDQFGLRLQDVGYAGEWASVELDGGADSFTATYRGVDGRMLATLLANRAAAVGAVRRELAARVAA